MKASLYLVAIVLLVAGDATAQISVNKSFVTTLTISSIHDIIDARSIALGEAMVARAGIESAWNSNPATLAGIDGAGAEYGHRDFNNYYLPDDYYAYYTAGVWLGTPVGTFALHYNRFDQGDWQLTYESGADSGGKFHLYDHTIALSYAMKPLPSLSLGASLKRFSEVTNPLSENIIGGESTASFYVDLGAAYSIAPRTGARDSLRIGAAVQNIGGDYQTTNRFPGSNVEYQQPLASWLRAGLAYDVAMLGDTNAPLLRGSVTAEYRRLLNPHSSFEGERVSYLGGGLEATIYDLVSLRLGTVIQPADDIYGKKGKPALRYGIGLNLPLQKIGIDIPLTFSFDYARIPLSDPYNDFVARPKLDDLDVIGVRVAYTAPIF